MIEDIIDAALALNATLLAHANATQDELLTCDPHDRGHLCEELDATRRALAHMNKVLESFKGLDV